MADPYQVSYLLQNQGLAKCKFCVYTKSFKSYTNIITLYYDYWNKEDYWTTLVSRFPVSLYCHHYKMVLEWVADILVDNLVCVVNKNEIISGCIQILHYFHKEIYFFFAIHKADILCSTILASQSQSPPSPLRSTNAHWAPNMHRPCVLGIQRGRQGSCSETYIHVLEKQILLVIIPSFKEMRAFL